MEQTKKSETMKKKMITKGKKKISSVMKEFSKKMLHSGSEKGPIVTKPAQAKAIALNVSKTGAKIPKKKKK